MASPTLDIEPLSRDAWDDGGVISSHTVVLAGQRNSMHESMEGVILISTVPLSSATTSKLLNISATLLYSVNVSKKKNDKQYVGL